MKRTLVGSAAVLGVGALVALSTPAMAVPVQADSGTPFGGFATSATASPLRIELHEPAIPIPADPQAELNFSYTKVDGASGPTTDARASAMWPGAVIGEGLKTLVEQLGLPSQLGAAGYPVQVNAQSPGDPSSASQEFLPGMVGRVSASDTHTVAKAAYSTSGTVAGDPDNATASGGSPDLLGALKNGDLGALGSLLTGTQQSTDTNDPPTANPLGALSLLVSVGGMSSLSRTDYTADTVSATATSELGEVDLLGGIVKLTGIKVTATSNSSLAKASTTQKVTYGGLEIAGIPFAFTSDGIEAQGSTTAIPGLPDDPTKALGALGISITMPKPVHTVTGQRSIVTATGPTITLDTAPLIKLLQLDKLPLGDLINQLPEQAGQAKGLLLALAQAHPKTVVILGTVATDANTIAAIGSPPVGGGTSTGTTGGGGVSSTGSGGSSAGLPTTGGDVPTAAGPPTDAAPALTTPIKTTSGLPGLPPLGSVPGLLTIGAILLGAGTGWWLRRGTAILFGGPGSCTHGLESGLPDLRKA